MSQFFQKIADFFRSLFGSSQTVSPNVTPTLETKPEVKPEIQSEVKAEAQPEVKSDAPVIEPPKVVEAPAQPHIVETPPHTPTIQDVPPQEDTTLPQPPQVPVAPQTTFAPNPNIPPLKLKIERVSKGQFDTLGKLSMNGEFVCFTLEDREQTPKVPNQSCIGKGIYKLALRKEGGLHATYSLKYRDMHKGVLWLLDVPDFKYIYLMVGNNCEDTKGCILVGNAFQNEADTSAKRGLLQSQDAYRKIYPTIAAHLEKGGEVTIEIV